jgi:hypothetical protein
MKKGFFSGYYVVESKLANLLGVQFFRYLIAHFGLSLRRLLYSNNLSSLDIALKNDGVCIIENFLEVDQLHLAEKEFNQLLRRATDSFEDGSTFVKRSSVIDLDSIPFVSEYICKNKRVVNLVQNAEGRKFDVSEAWFDIIKNGDPSVGDSQKVLHTDNFYATHKIWYFFDDVTEDHGPLVFAAGTSRFSLRRGIFEYVSSLFYDSQNVAWRPSQKWINFLKISPQLLTVPANTLVIANTHGFHRRGDAVPDMERRQIHFRVRINPLQKILSFKGLNS